MAIKTREELINALNEASEIEHGLLIQYLYTILTMKRRLDEGLTTRQQKETRGWQSSMLKVAREEMVHLGIVSNLLTSIGARPHFMRPNMPQQTGYYPFAFDLLPFGDEALHRFLVFENPRGAPPPPPPGANLGAVALKKMTVEAIAPEPLTYEYVGELYAKISEGFQNIPERQLFIGPAAAQMTWEIAATVDNPQANPQPDPMIQPVTSRQEALSAISKVIEQGEGAPALAEASHFQRFETIRQTYFDMGRFNAARNVPRNPATRPLEGTAGGVTLITNLATLKAAETFNVAYGAMLMMLDMVFQDLSPSPDAQLKRQILQLSIGEIMSVAIRPLGEILSELPLGSEADPARAGPPFEIYGDISSSPFETARWELLYERLTAAIEGCKELGTMVPRAALAAETLGFLLDNLKKSRMGAA